MLQTYQTKIKNATESSAIECLNIIASYFTELERKLFLDSFIRGKSRAACKNGYLKKYEITARQYNAIYIQLEGKVNSIIELNKLHVVELKDKIKSLEKYILSNNEKLVTLREKLIKLEKKAPFSEKFRKTAKQRKNIKFIIHQKKRKLAIYKNKLKRLEQDIKNGTVRICFGSKVLFKKQFELEANGYQSHAEWKVDWKSARSSQFFCIGSKDETAGNQTCTYTSNSSLRLKVPDKYKKDYGNYIIFNDIKFPYGQDTIDHARQSYIGITSGGKPVKHVNAAISYRFTKKEHGWYINATVEKEISNIVTHLRLGCLGVDLNAGFVSLCDSDRFGNPLGEESIPCPMYDRSTDQITASMGDVVNVIVNRALQAGKPIAIEKLDFSKKKSALGEESYQYARMLSGFAYSKFKEMLKARASKLGVEVIEVNPAYTSIIGQVKFMKRYGLSSHGSAACVIARRGLGLKLEKPKYDSILGNFKKTINHKALKSRWSTISYLSKKNYSFKARVELLKLEA